MSVLPDGDSSKSLSLISLQRLKGGISAQIANEHGSLKIKGNFNTKCELKIVWELNGNEYFSIRSADKMLTLSL